MAKPPTRKLGLAASAIALSTIFYVASISGSESNNLNNNQFIKAVNKRKEILNPSQLKRIEKLLKKSKSQDF